LSTIDSILDRVGLIRKTRSVVPEYHLDSDIKIRAPNFNLVQLYDVVSKNWVMQEIFRPIIQEVKRPGHEFKPAFLLKCSNCGMEYQTTVKKCEVCKSKQLRPPDPGQRKRAIGLFKNPNSDRENFSQILGSITYHDLVSDSWYISVEYRKMNTGTGLIPSEFKVRDPRYVRPVMDEYQKLRSNQWFCPICFDYKNPDVQSSPGVCKKCGVPLMETAYVQKVSEDITARWSRDQMVRGSTYRVLPEPFGTPRARSLWNIIHVLGFMDEWFMQYL